MENRVGIIMKTSIVGIVGNIILALFKVIIGTITNSISVLLDGVNNFADAGSSLITIVGTALAGKNADKKHPFGYGRLEYLSSLIIAGLILYAGISSLVESVKGIITPEVSEYSTVALIVIAVAIVVKLSLALYTQMQGKKAKSDSLVASGKEAILDVVVSLSTLVAAFIFIKTGIALEAYLATIISLIIIKAGIDVLKETISRIIGEPAEVDLYLSIKKTIAEFDKVNGAYDLVLNNYGPEIYTASVHVDVDETMNAKEMDVLSRQITDAIIEKYGVTITAVGFYAHNVLDENAKALEENIKKLALAQEYVKGLHGFYVNEEQKKISFDLVVSFDAKNRREVFENALSLVRESYPEYTIKSAMDSDFNEISK